MYHNYPQLQAEIHAHVSRVEVIAQAEATLLGDPANLIRGIK